MPYDYEQIANDVAGPGHRKLIRAIAEANHYNESMHMHEDIHRNEPCSYCWLRAGRAVRVMVERRELTQPEQAAK
jgi:hypothetical protein